MEIYRYIPLLRVRRNSSFGYIYDGPINVQILMRTVLVFQFSLKLNFILYSKNILCTKSSKENGL